MFFPGSSSPRVSPRPCTPPALPKSRHLTPPTITGRSEVRFLSFLQRATLRPAEKKRAAEKEGEATAVTSVASCDREPHRRDLGCRRQQSLEGVTALTSSLLPPPPPPLLPPFPAPMVLSLPQQERGKRQGSAQDAAAGGGGGDLGGDGVGGGGGGIGGGDDTPDNFLSVITRARGIRSNESNVFGA